MQHHVVSLRQHGSCLLCETNKSKIQKIVVRDQQDLVLSHRQQTDRQTLTETQNNKMMKQRRGKNKRNTFQ